MKARKIGRNDPCPCGSGKKYKRCCLEKDEANRVIRLGTGQEQDEETKSRAVVTDLVKDENVWNHPTYQEIAKHLIDNLKGEFDWNQIFEIVIIWNLFSSSVNPVIRKAGSYLAALEYTIARIYERDGVTQKSVAGKYNVSVGTVSQKALHILEFLGTVASELDEGSDEDAPDVLIPSMPRRTMIEREMSRIERLIGNRSFSSTEEANAYINKALERPDLQTDTSLSRREQAQDLLYDAMDEPSRSKRIRMAKKALELYPDSPDAFNILAEEANTPEKAANYYKQGMEAGERDLGADFFRENKGHFWGYVKTRPYMRSKFGYAEMCEYLGKRQEAIRHYRELLELNPNDNQGARYRLLDLYLAEKRFAEAIALLDAYDEISAHWAYSRFLVEYMRNGITPKLAKLWREARLRNPHVIPYLLGKKILPLRPPEYIGFGDESEAVAYVHETRHYWPADPNLLYWIMEQEKIKRKK